MPKLSRNHLTVAAATAAAAVGGSAIADAADKTSSTTTTERRPGDRGPGHGRPHGPGGRADLAAVAKTLGVTEAQLRSAVDAARPAGDPKDRGDRAADLATALGVETSKVQSILDANRPQRGAGGGHERGRPDDSALVTALAKGLSKTEAEVRAALTKVEQAHRSEREARETAMFAAIAKSLGKDAADVKAAFEAARPTRPTP